MKRTIKRLLAGACSVVFMLSCSHLATAATGGQGAGEQPQSTHSEPHSGLSDALLDSADFLFYQVSVEKTDVALRDSCKKFPR